MRKVRFDAFGEPVRCGEPAVQDPVSRWIMLAGTVLFWALVVVILVARAVYFDPDFASKFG